jgi:heterodisulfide reductase subunit B
MKQYGYYPGCSLSSSGKEYDLSCRAVCEALGIELVELKDWNCCGASSAHALDADIDLALSARTIYLCQREGLEMLVPCAACYSRTVHAWQVMLEDTAKREELEAEFGFTFREDLHIYHILQVIEKAAESQSPLAPADGDGLGVKKVVCYYGCLINRPRGINPHDDMENPQAMERILERYGYEPVPWSFATECCGAALSLTRDDVVSGLVDRIVSAAREAGADAIVTGCPLCQTNLESRQTEPFRVFYFTELLGAALGIEEVNDWWKMHLVDPMVR